MAGNNEAPVVLSTAIRDGSFPDSNAILSSELSSSTLPQLLTEISQNRRELSHDIQGVSKSLGGGIDGWIAKAKKVQDDIARCKEDARAIVEEHARVEAQRNDARELDRKSGLLTSEIDFTTNLQDQLQSIVNTTQRLKEIEELLSHQQAPQAAKALRDSRGLVSRIRGPQVLSIVREYETELIERTKRQLEETLYSAIVITRDSQHWSVEVKNSASGHSFAKLLTGLTHLNVLTESLHALTTRFESLTVHPLKKKTRLRLKNHSTEGNRFQVFFGDDDPSLSESIKFTTDIWDFLRGQLPTEMVRSLADGLLPKVVDTLITDWMTPAIPVQFHDLSHLDELQQSAAKLATYMETNGWPGAAELSYWIEKAPKIWLTKRKAETLDAVRKAFVASTGSLQQVQRTERQNAKETPSEIAPRDADDDWNTSWDEDKIQDDKQAEDDASGWGFDDEEPPSPEKTKHTRNGDSRIAEDDGDAWGWGDDDQSESKNLHAIKVNGEENQPEEPRDIVLTELYSITDIPDHLVEVIGRDLQDSVTLAEEQHTSLQDVVPSRGLLTLPTFALAMFRATAPTHYSSSPTLGNMNLYNDALHIAEKLRSMNAPKDMPSIEQDCKAMEKFGRSAYAREMDVQRTILTDLLDGAQGFAGCTQPIYAREIDNAVSSTVDRVRQVYQEWKPILSTSALLQSIGSLLILVISRVIIDIEEMEEISAPQSEALVGYASQITSLEDLFLAKPPGVDEGDEQSVPMTAVYVSNWLKFQYLINILDSSLVDIKFLWTEGELSLEFGQEELVDLIEALFQESSHRRSAIAAIKGHPASGIR